MMNMPRLTIAYLRDRPLSTILNILLLALAVGTMVILTSFASQLGNRLDRDAQGIDLVVGAKGSPLQLILSAIYQADVPTGNIPLATIPLLRSDFAVKEVIPIALGDNFRSFRIVGTEPSYPAHYGAQLEDGAMWKAPYEAVIGSEVARRTGAGLGQRFDGSHGLEEGGEEHKEHPYTVVGRLKPTGTVIDRLILTSVESVWEVHGIASPGSLDAAINETDHQPPHAASEHPSRAEVTALLVSYRSVAAALRLPTFINKQAGLQAAVPAIETTRLLTLVGVGIAAIRSFSVLLMMTAGLSIFVALYSVLRQREADMAMLRVMGARPSAVFGQIVFEGLSLALLGALLGEVLGRGIIAVAVQRFEQLRQLGLSATHFELAEVWIIGAAVLVGAVAALIPAAQVFRVDISETLSQAN